MMKIAVVDDEKQERESYKPDIITNFRLNFSRSWIFTHLHQEKSFWRRLTVPGT